MDVVVLQSDIARLVLGYLTSQKLSMAVRIFCKTSPYLKQEFLAYKKGLQAHSFLPELEKIICEYVKISTIVKRLLPEFRKSFKRTFDHDQISDILEELLTNNLEACRIKKKTKKSNSDDTTISTNCKNVNNIRCLQKRKRKLKRSGKLVDRELQTGDCKRRRVMQPYCYLSCKRNREFPPLFVTDDESECSEESTRVTGYRQLCAKSQTTETNESKMSVDKSVLKKQNNVLNTSNSQRNEIVSVANKIVVENNTMNNNITQRNDNNVSNTKKMDNIVEQTLICTEAVPCFAAIQSEYNTGTGESNEASSQILMEQNNGLLNTPATNFATDAPSSTQNTMPSETTTANDHLNCNIISANCSFNTILDPNILISKIITINANECINDFTTTDVVNGETAGANKNYESTDFTTTDCEQVLNDQASNVIRFPVFLTRDGELSGVPILLKSNRNKQSSHSYPMYTVDGDAPQSLKLNETENVNVYRNPLPENYIIMGKSQETYSKQTTTTNVTQQCTTIKVIKDVNSELMLRNDQEAYKNTPTAKCITNNTMSRNSSTPRKRESHVRALTFSPKGIIESIPSIVDNQVTVGIAEYINSNGLHSSLNNIGDDRPANKKSIIQDVEIIPALNITQNNLEINQTNPNNTAKEFDNVNSPKASVNTNLQAAGNVDLLEMTEMLESNQQISNACQSQEEQDQTLTSKVESRASLVMPAIRKYQNDKSMEEWLRLRKTSTNDLDTRLREINAQADALNPQKKLSGRRRITRRKQQNRQKNKRKVSVQINSINSINEIAEASDNQQQLNANCNNSNAEMTDDKIHAFTHNEYVENTKELGFQEISNSYAKCVENDKCNFNMALLLETPQKDFANATIPPTPGQFLNDLETPRFKKNSSDTLLHCDTSHVYASETKNTDNNRNLKVATPGARLSPFCTNAIYTNSEDFQLYETDGSSYYMPEEDSAERNKNTGKIIRDTNDEKAEELNNDFLVRDSEAKIEVEIPVETIQVQEDVLKRIKSTGAEDESCEKITKRKAHYKLFGDLPDICAANEEESSSSSSSSSCKSSSSSDSISSSDSSSSKKANSLESGEISEGKDSIRLSDISSPEDQDWQKLEIDNANNSGLVDKCGEVRYPLRSWFTPNKDRKKTDNKTDPTSNYELNPEPCAKMKFSLPLKTLDKQHKELEMKRERMKLKLQNDAINLEKKKKGQSVNATAPNISAALAASKRIFAMQSTAKKPSTSNTSNTDSKTPSVKESKPPLEVLSALQLSAKKERPKEQYKTSPSMLTTIQNSDDNAVSLPMKTYHSVTVTNAQLNSEAKDIQQNKQKAAEVQPNTQNITLFDKEVIRNVPTIAPANSSSAKTFNCISTIKIISPLPNLPKKSAKSIKTSENNTKVTTRSQKIKTISSRKESNAPTQAADDKTSALKQLHKPRLTIKIKPPIVSMKSKNQSDPQQSLLNVKENQNAETPAKQQNLPKVHSNNKEQKDETSATSPSQANAVAGIDECQKKQSGGIENAAYPVQEPSLCDRGKLADNMQLEDNAAYTENGQLCAFASSEQVYANSFYSIVYDGPDGPPTLLAPVGTDLQEFRMIVNFGENDSHTWKVDEGICLYSAAPQTAEEVTSTSIPLKASSERTIRNTPKKRKIDELVAIADANSPSPDCALRIPSATSTPCYTRNKKPSASQENENQYRGGKAEHRRATKMRTQQKKCIGAESPVEECSTLAEDKANESPNLESVDIESILAYLHGSQ